MSAAMSGAERPVTIVISADERRAEVTVEGRTQVVTGDVPKETRRAALDIASSHAADIGRSVLVDARDANGSWQLIINPYGVVRAAGGTDTPPPAASGRAANPRRSRTLAVVAGCVLLVVALAGGGAALLRLPPLDAILTSDDAESSAATLDARSAPPGFSQEADWRLTMYPGTQPAVAPDRTSAAFVNPDERLVVVGPDGSKRWSEPLPLAPDDITGAPHFVRDGGGYAPAITGKGKLWQWPAKGGDPATVDLPDGATATFSGTSPLVSTGENAFVPVEGELKEVDPPDDAGALIADGEDVLTAVQRGPWTWVTPDGESSEVDPATPEGAGKLDEVLTARADRVIARWSTSSEKRVVLAVHDARDGSVVASETIAGDELDGARWVEDRRAAAYGPVVVDLKDGSTDVHSGFAPESAAGDMVFGELGGTSFAIGADGKETELAGDTARPWGTLDGRAVVVAEGELYALSAK